LVLLRARDLSWPGADAAEEVLRPSVDRLQNDPSAFAPHDDLVLILGEATVLW
jgi:hypothetical protein